MKILKFTLSGKTAFFKKPDVNSNFYFTYGHIHKVALMGIFGAILGYGGYNQQIRNKMDYPEFYDKLKHIKISIVPQQVVENNNTSVKNKIQNGYFNKIIQTFNNTVGYANKDGNLIIKEQWLEDVCWDIYLLLQGSIEEEITYHVLRSETVFTPYLGKNDHLANITSPELLEAEEFNGDGRFSIESLYLKENFQVSIVDELDDLFDIEKESVIIYKYEERLPIGLELNTNQYVTVPFAYTNATVELRDSQLNITLYKCNNKILEFY